MVGLRRSHWRRWRYSRRLWCEQGGRLEQAAELFLAGAVMGPFTSSNVLHHFVPDFEMLQMDDADEFLTLFPDLTLSKF
jgi:hypothetical protein